MQSGTDKMGPLARVALDRQIAARARIYLLPYILRHSISASIVKLYQYRNCEDLGYPQCEGPDVNQSVVRIRPASAETTVVGG